MDAFKSIVIPEKIVIVENSNGQGYVVPYGNKKVLESALNWARTTVKGEGATLEEQWKNAKDVEGIINEYVNGKFKLKLSESADNSCNGGKLSFWNCNIIAPDGKTFLIGINQSLLCKLLLNCNLIKGEVQQNIWLGREGNNVGAYTEQMEDFLQAKKELEKRNLKRTSKYEAGDVVGTLTMEFVYLGKITPKYYIRDEYDYKERWDSNKRNLYVQNAKEWQLKEQYLYLEKYKGEYWALRPSEKKHSYINFNKKENVTLDMLKEIAKENKHSYLLLDVLQYLDLSPMEIKDELDSIGKYKYTLA